MSWHRHPGVRTGEQLTLGERSADKMRNGMGSWAFVFGALAFLAVWMLVNRNSGFDPYPFILLNLVFSTQAAYAAPLILLAQNRQADRDKVQLEQDRARDEQSVANTEYLLREVASLRLAVNDVATRDFVRSELQQLFKELEQARLDER